MSCTPIQEMLCKNFWNVNAVSTSCCLLDCYIKHNAMKIVSTKQM